MGSPTSGAAAPEGNLRSHGRAQPTAGREGTRRRTWPSEAPPTTVGAPMAGVLGELAFYYGACWLYYRSEQRRGAWMR